MPLSVIRRIGGVALLGFCAYSVVHPGAVMDDPVRRPRLAASRPRVAAPGRPRLHARRRGGGAPRGGAAGRPRVAGRGGARVRRDRRVVREVDRLPRGGRRGDRRASSSASTTTMAPRRTRPAGSTTTPTWSIRPTAGSTPSPTGGAPWPAAGLERVASSGWSATPPPSPRAGGRRSPSASSTAATARSRRGPTTAGWAPHVAVGGWLAIHDVFADPADGGRPPYELWRAALASGQWVEDGEQRQPAGAAQGRRRPLRTARAQPGRRRAEQSPVLQVQLDSGRSRGAGSPSPRKSPDAGVAPHSASAARIIAAAV